MGPKSCQGLRLGHSRPRDRYRVIMDYLRWFTLYIIMSLVSRQEQCILQQARLLERRSPIYITSTFSVTRLKYSTCIIECPKESSRCCYTIEESVGHGASAIAVVVISVAHNSSQSSQSIDWPQSADLDSIRHTVDCPPLFLLVFSTSWPSTLPCLHCSRHLVV